MTPAIRSVSRTPAPPPGPRSAARPAASRYASAQLDPRPDAAAQARHLTRDCLERWNLCALTVDAQAIAAELTANAVAVPPGTPGLAITYAIHARHPELRIYTWDIGPGQPRPRPATPCAQCPSAGKSGEPPKGKANVHHNRIRVRGLQQPVRRRRTVVPRI